MSLESRQALEPLRVNYRHRPPAMRPTAATLWLLRLREERVQGWACVVFTVTADGSLHDAKVTASAPEGYFEEAAVDAVRQWTYQQRDSPGQSTVLTFALDR
jgi:TonB family protein